MAKKILFFLFFGIMTLVPVFGYCGEGDTASPEEVIEMVNKAADYLAEEGQAGLQEFNDKNGPWIFGDTYVFVFDCKGENALVGHIQPHLIGMDLNKLKSPEGTNIGSSWCWAVAENPERAWVR